jgi:VCBS repeat-containing protein
MGGTWTLEVYDAGMKDTGTLNWWSITAVYIPPEPNEAPVAGDDAYTVAEDNTLTVATPGVLDNDTDADGHPLTANLVTGPAHGSLTLNADGSFSYTPDSNFNGTDTFTYVANDGRDDSNVATVSITINPIADPPVAVDDADSTTIDTAVVVDVLANDSDPDGDSLNIVVPDPDGPAITTANGGSVTSDGAAVTYTPPPGFMGTDTFSYTVSDGNGGTDTATVEVDVSEATPETPLYVFDIRFESKAGGKFWQAVFEIRSDSDGDGQGTDADAAVAGVAITVEFAGQTYTGTTDSEGIFRTNLVKDLASGEHYAEVVDLVLADYFWDPLTLDVPDDSDGDGFPDDLLSLP